MAIPMIPMIPSWFPADSVRKAPKRPSLQLHSWTTFCLWCRFLKGSPHWATRGHLGIWWSKMGIQGIHIVKRAKHLRAELYNKSVPKTCYLEKIFQSYVWVRVAPMGEASKGDRIELRSDQTPKVSKLFQPSSAQISELSPIHPDRRLDYLRFPFGLWVAAAVLGAQNYSRDQKRSKRKSQNRDQNSRRNFFQPSWGTLVVDIPDAIPLSSTVLRPHRAHYSRSPCLQWWSKFHNSQ